VPETQFRIMTGTTIIRKAIQVVRTRLRFVRRDLKSKICSSLLMAYRIHLIECSSPDHIIVPAFVPLRLVASLMVFQLWVGV